MVRETRKALATRWLYFRANHRKREHLVITDSGQKGDDIYPMSCKARGFFSLFNEILDTIALYGTSDISVVLNHTHYNERETDNMWDYYFEPVQNVSKRNYKASFNIRPFRDHRIMESPKKIALLHEVLQKRVVVKKEIQQDADAFYAQHLSGHTVIGVHFRGYDVADNFAIVSHLLRKAPPEDYCSVLDSTPFDYVFLATDDMPAYEFFQKRYPGKVISFSRLRDDTKKVVLAHSDKFSKKELGREVLIDCLLLSRCNILLHGSSNIPAAAKFLNPALKTVNLDVLALEKEKRAGR